MGNLFSFKSDPLGVPKLSIFLDAVAPLRLSGVSIAFLCNLISISNSIFVPLNLL